MKRFSTRLYTSPYYKPREEIHLTIEFINETSQSVSVSKNISEAFKIGDEKKSVKPKEKNKDRVNHSAFFTVPANSSIIKKVNLKASKSKAAGSLQKLKSIRTHIRVKGSKRTANVLTENNSIVDELLDHPGVPCLMQPVKI